MLEIEEEFDLSLLGIDGGHVLDKKPSVLRLPARRSASGLLRAVTAPYESADWAPKSVCNQTSPVNGSHVNEENEISAKDFATEEVKDKQVFELPLPNGNGGGDGGVEMDKTESFISTVLSDRPRRGYRVISGKRRLLKTGRGKYRPSIRILRSPSPSLDTSSAVDTEMSVIDSTPSAATPFQRDFVDTFGRHTLLKAEQLSKLDSSVGNHLPPVIRDLFPALAEPASAIKLANTIRRQFDLPQLSLQTDKIALRRAIALMRDNLYVEIITALTIPLAPLPQPREETETDEDKRTMSLTPTNLFKLSTKMPLAFPREKTLIKSFLADDYQQAYGEHKGQVVWQGGIGRMRGAGEGGFRGKYEESPIHVFVDHSNILYGLLHHLGGHPSDALPPRHLRTLSLPCISLLLRRGRPTPPGSLHLVASSPLYQNLDPLVRLGWEVAVMKRVELYEDEVSDPTSMHTTPKPHSRIAGVDAVGLRRYKEQGVDEILQLGILTMINSNRDCHADKEKRTLVLATGDARGGQFNREGFIGAVKEALKRGWEVELWSFKSGLSRSWIDLARKTDGKFTIWALDDWAEQLVEVAEEADE